MGIVFLAAILMTGSKPSPASIDTAGDPILLLASVETDSARLHGSHHDGACEETQIQGAGHTCHAGGGTLLSPNAQAAFDAPMGVILAPAPVLADPTSFILVQLRPPQAAFRTHA